MARNGTSLSFINGTLPGNLTSTSFSGVGSGGVAGTAVACFLGGVLLSSLVSWLMTRHKSSRLQSSNRHNIAEPVDNKSDIHATELCQFNKAAHTTASLENTESRLQFVRSIEDVLPQPIDSTILKRDLATIKTLIRQHAANFYSRDIVDMHTLARSINRPVLATICSGAIVPDACIASLSSITTRNEAIVFILASAIMRPLEISNRGTSLLPLGGLLSHDMTLNGPRESGKSPIYCMDLDKSADLIRRSILRPSQQVACVDGLPHKVRQCQQCLLSFRYALRSSIHHNQKHR